MDIKKLANEVLDSSVESSKENKSWNDYVGEFSKINFYQMVILRINKGHLNRFISTSLKIFLQFFYKKKT